MNTPKRELTAATLRELLCYAPETGLFVWLVRPSIGVAAGSIAGYCSGAYRKIRIFGRNYPAHRLAWLYMTGEWPSNLVDHIDGSGTNNRWVNLRDVTASTNMQNQRRARKDNRAGLIGVHMTKKGGYTSTINVRGVPLYLGHFKNAELANEAYITAKRKLHDGGTL